MAVKRWTMAIQNKTVSPLLWNAQTQTNRCLIATALFGTFFHGQTMYFCHWSMMKINHKLFIAINDDSMGIWPGKISLRPILMHFILSFALFEQLFPKLSAEFLVILDGMSSMPFSIKLVYFASVMGCVYTSEFGNNPKVQRRGGWYGVDMR